MPYISNNIVPDMTSDTSPSGKSSASDIQSSSYPAWKAFSYNEKESWSIKRDSEQSPAWIAYEFQKPKRIVCYSLLVDTTWNPIQTWNFEASNDGKQWTVLQSYVLTNSWSQFPMQVFDVNNSNYYTQYRINITNRRSVALYVYRIEMMELNYYSNILIHHSGNFKKFHLDGWVSINSLNPNEEDFIEHGMQDINSIPESAWAELQGEIELCYYTDDPNKNEVIFKVETEPFTLEDEFKDQTISILEYTDDPYQTESVITLETEPFTLYDELGDNVDVLYYTDDPDKTEATLEITANYSPLDELDGDVEVVTWTAEEPEEKMILEVEATPVQQLVIQPEEFKLYGDLHQILLNKVGELGTLRFLLSFDNGRTWQACKYKEWYTVDIQNINSVKSRGMSAYDLSKLNQSLFKSKGESIRIAYLLDDSIHTNESIGINNVALSVNSPTGNVKFGNLNFHVLNTVATAQLTFTGNKIRGDVEDEEQGNVQYRVFLNDNPYYPQDGSFTSLAPSPVEINLNISERQLHFDRDNKLRVEFRDGWGKSDVWETVFTGTYSGIMFKDESGQYLTNSFGELLKHLDFGTIIAGQTTLEKKSCRKEPDGRKGTKSPTGGCKRKAAGWCGGSIVTYSFSVQG